MLTANTEKLCGIAANGYFGPAVVCEVHDGNIYLSIPGAAERLEVAGTIAIPDVATLGVGTRVLAAAQHLDDVYIIGVLDKPKELESQADDLPKTRDITVHEHENVRVFSESRELLFEHDPAKRVTRVCVPSGDLEFVAEDGNIRFETAGGIELQGKQAVLVNSENAIQLGVTDPTGLVRSEYALGAHDQRIETPQFRLKAASLHAQASETRFTSQTLRGRFGSVRVVAQTMESVVDTVIQKAKNSFARVSGLWQIKSERVSCESESSMHLKSKNAYIKSEEDVKIDGKQIHLG